MSATRNRGFEIVSANTRRVRGVTPTRASPGARRRKRGHRRRRAREFATDKHGGLAVHAIGQSDLIALTEHGQQQGGLRRHARAANEPRLRPFDPASFSASAAALG